MEKINKAKSNVSVRLAFQLTGDDSEIELRIFGHDYNIRSLFSGRSKPLRFRHLDQITGRSPVIPTEVGTQLWLRRMRA